LAKQVASSSPKEKPQTLDIVSREQGELVIGWDEVLPLASAFLVIAFS